MMWINNNTDTVSVYRRKWWEHIQRTKYARVLKVFSCDALEKWNFRSVKRQIKVRVF